MKHIFSWNVNGIRAAAKKGSGAWFRKADPDIPCVQETKAHPDGYHAHWAWAEKKGYRGVAVVSKEEPVAVSQMGIDRFDSEGRVLQLEYRDFVLITAYFPNSRSAATTTFLTNRLTLLGRRKTRRAPAICRKNVHGWTS